MIEILNITPEPTAHEREAIELALNAAWPKPKVPLRDDAGAWRFSKRWNKKAR